MRGTYFLTEAEAAEIRADAQEIGDDLLSRDVGLSRVALVRAGCQLGVHSGTVAVIRGYLARKRQIAA